MGGAQASEALWAVRERSRGLLGFSRATVLEMLGVGGAYRGPGIVPQCTTLVDPLKPLSPKEAHFWAV